MKAKVKFIAITLLLLSLSSPVLAPATTQAQIERQWSDPTNLSTKMSQAWFPDIAVDSQGGAHVLFSGSDFFSEQSSPLWQKFDKVYYQPISAQGEVDKNGPFNVAVSPYGVVTRSSLAVDNVRGLLHMLFRSKGSLYYQYARIDKASSPLAWSEPRNIDDMGSSYYSDIAVDSRGVVHIIWSQVLPDDKGKFRQVIMYRQSIDLGVKWSYPTMIAAPKLAATRPVLKIDAQGGLHVSWDDGYDNYVPGDQVATYGAYSHSLDDGKTWSTPVWFGTESNPIVQMVNTTFGSNGVMLAWRVIKSQQVNFVVSNDRGTTWSNPAPIPGLTARAFSAQHFFDRYYLAADGKGQVIFAGVAQMEGIKKSEGEKPTDLGVFLAIWNKTEWSSPELIAQVPGYPEYPRLGIGPDRIHVVWFVRDSNVDEGNKQLWYSSRPYDSGLKAQPVKSYVAPTPTPEVAAVSVPTPTPLAILPPVDSNPSRAWMEEGYSSAVLALVPVLLVGLGMAGFIGWRIRRLKGK